MQDTQKRIKNISFIMASIALLAIIGVYFMTHSAPELTTVSSNPAYDSKSRRDDTILMVQGTPYSRCDNPVQLTDAELLALPQQSFTTRHEWADKPQHFQGPFLKDVLELSCPDVTDINLRALNDYRIDVKLENIAHLKPILAHTIDGERTSIRDKGPLWLMVDIDDLEEKPQGLAGLLIWQLSDIIITHTQSSS